MPDINYLGRGGVADVRDRVGVLEAQAGIARGFAFGDATPDSIGTLTAGARITRCRVDITQPFDGAGARVSVGTLALPQLVMSDGGNLCSEAGIYTADVSLPIAVDTELFIFITPGAGATTGAGQVSISVA